MSGTDRVRLPVAIVAVFGYRLLHRWGLPSSWDFAANAAMVVVLAVLAWGARLSIDEVGLARERAPAGLRLGLLALALVAAVTAAALALGVTAGLTDERVLAGLPGLLYLVLWRIPLGTVALEELAFRGLMLGLLCRRMTAARALVASAVLFAVWHVPPLAGRASAAEIGGVVATTFVAGLGFGWLRLRSGSLLAPALAHYGTNAVTLSLAWWWARWQVG